MLYSMGRYGEKMRENDIPLFCLESGDELKNLTLLVLLFSMK